jgi:hypothetical protein
VRFLRKEATVDQKRFSWEGAIKFGWKATLDHLGFFIRAMIIIFVISISLSVVTKMTEKSMPVLSLITNLTGVFFSLLFGVGLIKVYLKICDGKQPELRDLLSGITPGLMLRYFFAALLYTLIFIGGLILLIIPGIIWLMQFQFCTYLVIDKSLGPVAALKKSSGITKGAKWDLFVLTCLSILINLAGILALGIGLFVTVPLTMLALTSVYRKLLNESGVAAG